MPRPGHGDFGLAFWEGRASALTLARGQLGVKQVYYHDNGKRTVFAARSRRCWRARTSARAGSEAINQYLHFHTPLFERTFFKGLSSCSGQYLTGDPPGSASSDSIWRSTTSQPRGAARRKHAAGSASSSTWSSASSCMSDVPVGSFFSGGIDSCAVAALRSAMARGRTASGSTSPARGCWMSALSGSGRKSVRALARSHHSRRRAFLTS